VRRAVVQDPVIDLVGENDQVVAAGQLHHALEDLFGVDRAGRVVRVNDHQRSGPYGDLGLDVGQIRRPPLLLVTQVVHRRATAERDPGRPQRVVGRRDEDFVAVVEQRLQSHHDQLGHAVAQVDVLDVEIGEPLLLIVLHDGAPGGQDALGLAVAVRRRQVADDVLEDLVGCVEAERRGVADVQLEDVLPLGLQLHGSFEHRAANVVEHTGELV
jgi:hypothetical protein